MNTIQSVKEVVFHGFIMSKLTAQNQPVKNKLVTKLPTLLLLLILVCVTSAFNQELYNSYWIPKSLVFLYGSVFANAIFLVFLLVRRHQANQLCNANFLIIWLLQGCIITSTFLSMDPTISFYGSYWRQMGLLVSLPILFSSFYACSFLKNRSNVHLFCILLSFLAAMYALFGIMQRFGFKLLNIDILYGRAAGFQGNPDFYAPFLLLLTFPCLSLAAINFTKRRYVRGSVFTAFFMVILVAILCTLTRGTWIGFIAASLLWSMIFVKFILKDKLKLVLCVGVSCLVIVGVLFFVANKYSKRLPHYQENAIDKVKSIVLMKNKVGLTNQRIYLWQDTLSLSLAQLKSGRLFGTGWEYFNRPFLPFKSLKLAQVAKSIVYDDPHNQYLAMLVKTGPLGFLVFLFFFIWQFFIALTFIRKSKRLADRILVLGIMSSIIGYAVNLITIFPTISGFILLFLLNACLSVFCYHGFSLKSTSSLNRFNIYKGILILWTLLIIALSIYGVKHYSKTWQADNYYEKGRFLIIRATAPLDKVEKAIENLEKAVELCPYESFYENELIRANGMKAAILREEGKLRYANDVYFTTKDDTLDHADKNWAPDIMYLALAINACNMRYYEDGIELFENALKYDRWCYSAHTSLATLLYLRYQVENNPKDLKAAFDHSFTSYAKILRYSPHRDKLALDNILKYGNELYKKNQDPDVLEKMMQTFDTYVRYYPTPEKMPEFMAFFQKTKYETTAYSALLYFNFIGVKKGTKMDPKVRKARYEELKKMMQALKLNDNYYNSYMKEVNDFKL